MKSNRITLRSLVVGVVFAAVFAVLTLYSSNRLNVYLTNTQIPEMPFILLIVMVLLLNPLCRLVRFIRAFSTVEILIIFIMGLVSAGLSTYGLTAHLVPVVGSLFYKEWNTPQSEWNRYVVPHMRDAYFVSMPGIQTAAQEYHKAAVNSLELQSSYNTARRYKASLTRVARAEEDLRKIKAVRSEAKKDDIKLSLAKVTLENARAASRDAEQEWLAISQSRGLPDIDEVLQTYPELIEQSEAGVEQAQGRLNELESEVFEQVEVFRRGLPEGMSAYPGFFPDPRDDMRSYFGRFRRLSHGMSALNDFKKGLGYAKSLPAAVPPAADATSRLGGFLDSALASLLPLCETADLEKQKELLRKEDDLLRKQRNDLNEWLKQLSEQRRSADRSEAMALDKEIKQETSVLKKHERLEKKLKLSRERNEWQLACALNLKALSDDIGALKSDLQAGTLTASEFKGRVNDILPAFASADISLRCYFIGEVPWSIWLRPMARWALLLAVTYIILMSLNVLIFRQWAYHERLTYPQAELPKALAGGSDPDGSIPSLFRNGLFWVGFAVSASVVGWNLLCATQVVPGLKPIDLNNAFNQYLSWTVFHGIRYNKARIFFTVIGLSFLVPRNISFSLWFFHVLFMIQVLVLVWTGHGEDYYHSFPSDWWYLHSFRTAQGHGALMVFAGLVLFKCRKYILCVFMPSKVRDLDRDEQKELILSSFAFISCSVGLILLLWRDMGANLYFALFFYFVTIALTIGLVRAVTEGGILGFQSFGSPLHIVRAFFGFNKSWTCASLFSPLIVYYTIFFLDIKTFVAPAMANALKLRDDFKMKRGIFHLAIFLAIAVASATAIITCLMLCYHGGADTMENWFYTAVPKGVTFNNIRTLIKNPIENSPSTMAWFGVGAVAMAALLFFRQFMFWLPHPLGMVMLINPLMGAYWFSILLGWLCNTAVTKYGHKATYHRARGAFIGLIVGELLIIILGVVISMIAGKTFPGLPNLNASSYAL